jgi:VWFA-related protein
VAALYSTRRVRFCSGLLGAQSVLNLLASLVIAQAQAPATPTFRARTELVQLDVVVVDDAGHAVRGLTAADFMVRDRGTPQRIAQAEEISHTPLSAEALPADVRRDVADNIESRADRLIVLVLDDLHFQGKTDDVKAMARRVVEGVGAGASLALVTTSGTFGVEPTIDRAVMLAEIDRFLDRFDPEGRRLAPGAQMPRPVPIRNAMGAIVTERGPSNLGQFFGDMGSYKVLESVAKRIGTDGGRRNAFVWISGGMDAPVDEPKGRLASDGENWYLAALAGVLQALQKANAAAYGISTGDFSSRPMRKVADETGGFVMSAQAFDRELPTLIEDLDHYYLIGFYPEGVADRGFHELEVRVNRPGMTARYRHGYAAGARPAALRNGVDLARLSQGTLPVTDLPLRMFAAPLPPARKHEPRTAIALEVRVPRALLTDGDGLLRDTLHYEVWAVDLRRKKVVKTIARQAQLVLDRDEAAADQAEPLVYQVHTMLPLDAGRYQLRASAMSVKSGASGSIYLETDVPDYDKSPLLLAPVAVAYVDTRRLPVVRGGAGVGLLPAPLALDRAFTLGDRLRLSSEVVQRAAGMVSVKIDLLTASGERGRSLLDRQIDRGDPRAVDVELDLAGLAAGGYRLRFAADAGGVHAEREIAFIVR